MASHTNARGWRTILIAHLEIALVKAETGDHKGALAILEKVSPLVHEVAKHEPFYFYVYQNELAIELGESGRIAEAKASSEIALASPYAVAYPNWAETREELEAKHTSTSSSVLAISRANKTEATLQTQSQRNPQRSKALAFHGLASKRDSLQRPTITIPARTTTALNAISTLDRVLICIGSRAPPSVPEATQN